MFKISDLFTFRRRPIVAPVSRLEQLENLVLGCQHSTAPIAQIQNLLHKLPITQEVVAILVAANNFDVMELAIDLDAHQGKFCADKLMLTASEHLKHAGHADRATWARRRLFLAERWYERAGALTANLKEEIQEGLKKTEWITTQS